MKRSFGLTYAGCGSGAGRPRRTAAATWRDLRLQARGAWAEPRPVLNRPGRWLIGLLLLAVSVTVLGKEPVLRDSVVARLSEWWERLVPSGPTPALSKTHPQAKAVPIRASEPGAAPVAVSEPDSQPAPEPRPAELTPLALISDGGLFVLGTDGRLQPADVRALGGRVPVVTGVPVREVPGPMSINLEAPVDIALVRRILAGVDAEQLSEINFANPREIVLYFRDTVKVKLERGPQVERNLWRLAAIRADLRRRGLAAAVIDLRYLQQAVVRPRGLRK